MKRSYWVPILALLAAIAILVPTTFASGEPGTTLTVQLGANRFPGGATSALAKLTFQGQSSVQLDVSVTGTDLRDWVIRIYSQGNCNAVQHWIVNRDTDGNFMVNALLVPRVHTNAALSMQLFGGDVVRLRDALAHNRPLALMLAGEGSGGDSSSSPYRTCAAFGTTPPVTTTNSTTTTTTPTTTSTSPSTTTTTLTAPSFTGTASTSTSMSTTSTTTSTTTSATSATGTGTTSSSTSSSTTTGGTVVTVTLPETVTTLTTITSGTSTYTTITTQTSPVLTLTLPPG